MADSTINALTAAAAALTTHELPANEGGSDVKVTLAQAMLLMGVKKIALASDATANSTTTAAKITGLDLTLGVGTYKFEYWVRYVSSIITTGVKFSVNHTGTVTYIAGNLRYVDAAATASTGAPSQAANASTAQVMGAYSFRAKSAAAGIGPTLSTDTTGDMLLCIEGTLIVTVSGNIELWHASETAASTTVKAGSLLIVTQVL